MGGCPVDTSSMRRGGTVTKKPLIRSQHDLMRFFHQHVVLVCFHFHRDGAQQKPFVINAIVFSVEGQWLLLTAGHCLEDVARIRENGYELKSCALIDSMGIRATNHLPVPFDYDNSTPLRLNEKDPNYDYGLMYVSDHYRRLLEANKVIPLNEQAWQDHPDHIDKIVLLGLPAERWRQMGESLELSPAVLSVEPLGLDVLEDLPADFRSTSAPTFYGRVALPEGLDSIKGMSGGPIFTMCTCGQTHKYWLHSIQSKWIASERAIASVLVGPLGEFLREVIVNGVVASDR